MVVVLSYFRVRDHNRDLNSWWESHGIGLCLLSGVTKLHQVVSDVDLCEKGLRTSSDSLWMVVVLLQDEMDASVFSMEPHKSVVLFNFKRDGVLVLQIVELDGSREKKISSFVASSACTKVALSSHELVSVEVEWKLV